MVLHHRCHIGNGHLSLIRSVRPKSGGIFRSDTEAAEQAEAEAEEVLEEVRTKEMGHRGVGRVAN